jgi:hypothetical protein
MWLFFGLPVLTLFIMLAIHTSFSINKVKQNWEEHRCNPLYIPFANMMNPEVSVSDNFTHCTDQMGTEVFKMLLDPINALFGEIGSTLKELASPLKLFRELFSRIRKFMMSFAASTFSKIASSTSVFVHYLIKIRDVLKRFVGEGYIAAFLVNAIADFIMAFVYLCISIIKTFVYALLAISIILALFQPEMLVVAITLASLLAASGY